MTFRDRFEKARDEHAARFAADKAANERRLDTGALGCLIVFLTVAAVVWLISLFGK